MSAAFALQSFRSRTASLSSRTLGRAVVLTRTSPLSRRHYSEQKSTAEAGEGKDGIKPGDAPLTPEQEKLKAKEAEVVDLTVCGSSKART